MISTLATLVAIGSFVLAGTSTAQVASDDASSTLASVSWLTGCWEMNVAGLIIEEHWMPPRGGTMLGMSRTVQGDATTGFEVVMIREVEGRLLYEAHPSGQAAAVFQSTQARDGMIAFENRQHDFPRRIVYRRVAADSMRAVIDDGEGGGKIEFRYGWTDCGR